MSDPTPAGTLARRGVLIASAAGLAAASGLAHSTRAHARTKGRVASDYLDRVGGNDTTALQAILDDPTVSHVVIDNIGRDWIAGQLFLNRSSVTIEVEAGTVVRGAPGAFPGPVDSLLTIAGQTDIKIIGYGATFAMDRAELSNLSGEWRMSIMCRSVTRLTILGLTIDGSGGDGIYLGVIDSINQPCRDIEIRDVTCRNQYRNGISVVSAENLVIEGCSLVETYGTLPGMGLDFEPNYATQVLRNIVVRDCYIAGNSRLASAVYVIKLSGDLGIRYERVNLLGTANTVYPVDITWPRPNTTTLTGTVEFDGCTISSKSSQILTTSHILPPSSGVRVINSALSNEPGIRATLAPICIRSYEQVPTASVPVYGGLALDGVRVRTKYAGPFLRAMEGTTSHLDTVAGTVAVSAPNGVTTDYGAAPVNVTLAVTDVTTIPAATVTIAVDRPSARRGTTVNATFTRTGDTGAALGLYYTTTGTAIPRRDFGGLPLSVVFPPGQATVTVPVRLLATRGGAPVDLKLNLAPGEGYQPGATQSSATITFH